MGQFPIFLGQFHDFLAFFLANFWSFAGFWSLLENFLVFRRFDFFANFEVLSRDSSFFGPLNVWDIFEFWTNLEFFTIFGIFLTNFRVFFGSLKFFWRSWFFDGFLSFYRTVQFYFSRILKLWVKLTNFISVVYCYINYCSQAKAAHTTFPCNYMPRTCP